MAQAESERMRVVMFPWLAHGHITPYLELAKRLIARAPDDHLDVVVHLVSTPANLAPLAHHQTDRLKLVELHLPVLPDLPPALHTTKGLPARLMPVLKRACDLAAPRFGALLDELCPDIVFYDFIQPWAPLEAAERGVPAVHFGTGGATSTSFFVHCLKTDERSPSAFPFEAISLGVDEDAKYTALVTARQDSTCTALVPERDRLPLSLERSSGFVAIKSCADIMILTSIEYKSETLGDREAITMQPPLPGESSAVCGQSSTSLPQQHVGSATAQFVTRSPVGGRVNPVVPSMEDASRSPSSLRAVVGFPKPSRKKPDRLDYIRRAEVGGDPHKQPRKPPDRISPTIALVQGSASVLMESARQDAESGLPVTEENQLGGGGDYGAPLVDATRPKPPGRESEVPATNPRVQYLTIFKQMKASAGTKEQEIQGKEAATVPGQEESMDGQESDEEAAADGIPGGNIVEDGATAMIPYTQNSGGNGPVVDGTPKKRRTMQNLEGKQDSLDEARTGAVGQEGHLTKEAVGSGAADNLTGPVASRQEQ